MSLNKRVAVAKLEARPALFDLHADAAERAELAARNGVLAIDSLDAHIELRRLEGGRISLDGRLGAKLTQRCVITLEPLAQSIDEPFHYDFGPAEDLVDPAKGEVQIDLNSDLEPLPGDVLELGDLVAEQLALAIDPYPKAPGAQLQAPAESAESDGKGGKNSPFAALAALKPKV